MGKKSCLALNIAIELLLASVDASWRGELGLVALLPLEPLY